MMPDMPDICGAPNWLLAFLLGFGAGTAIITLIIAARSIGREIDTLYRKIRSGR